MPEVVAFPEVLKGYRHHGVQIDLSKGKNALADCPFCGKEGKWAVNVENGLWRCYVCMPEGGNLTTFIRKLWDESDKATKDYGELAANRKLLYPDTLMQWGAARSIINRAWLLPGYNVEGKLTQLYKYTRMANDKMALLATPTLHHGLHGVPLFDKAHEVVYVCEGPWDGMALWEVVKGGASVLAVPGLGTFQEPWVEYLRDKHVVLMYDSDHPTEKMGPAGFLAMKRVAGLLKHSEISYLSWSTAGYDPDKPTGYDVRDYLSEGNDHNERVARMNELITKIEPVPSDWKSREANQKAPDKDVVECLPCGTYKDLEASWRKAMQFTEGLNGALSVALACIISTKQIGDQLWCRLIGPPSCGKSVICEALSINKRWTFATSSLTGFHSGWKTDKKGEEDHGLVPKIKDKTLIVKDGDTLLSAPNLRQILAEARDLFDTTARVNYRHGVTRNHEGVRWTWILCGTESLRQLDSSELGERFVDWVIMEDIDDDLEDEIGWRVANRADRESSVSADGTVQSMDNPDMVYAKRLTGGYINYLRENAPILLGKVQFPEEHLRRCMILAKYVAYMRARPSKIQEEKAQRELSFRLVSQFVRLAKCLAAVHNKAVVDADVMKLVTKVAMNTGRGTTVEICKTLYDAGEEGVEFRLLQHRCHQVEERLRILVRFLRKIGVIEMFTPVAKKIKLMGNPRWRLTGKLRRTFKEVHGAATKGAEASATTDDDSE